jgi:hypothetical protein
MAQDRAAAIGLGRRPPQRRLSALAVSRDQGATRGPKKAIVAVAASILNAAYRLVRGPVPYKELGPVYLLRLDHERAAARLTQACELRVMKSTSGKRQLNSQAGVYW